MVSVCLSPEWFGVSQVQITLGWVSQLIRMNFVWSWSSVLVHVIVGSSSASCSGRGRRPHCLPLVLSTLLHQKWQKTAKAVWICRETVDRVSFFRGCNWWVYSLSTGRPIFMLSQFVVWSIICKKKKEKDSGHHNFVEPKVTSSNCFSCPPNSVSSWNQQLVTC